MKNIDLSYKIAGIDLPHLNPNDRLQRILKAALPNQGDKSSQQLDYWDAEFFNLHRVQIFQQASLAEQSAILGLTNRSLLAESYFIEKAGVGYMAKMVLLAETVEERMLYGLFTADEATHLSQIIHFLPEIESTNSNDPFLNLLAEVVESADKTVLLFVLQVVLEGWGLSHYRRLAKECHHPILAELFTSFLQAESRHHGTGTTLFNQMSVSADSQAIIMDVLAQFLFMVQVGPQNVLAAIEKVKGDLTRSQKIQILEELDTQIHSGTRLQILRSLMRGASADAIVQALDERGAFEPLPAYQCVF
ncbi:ferritin-like domain-containing protein [Nostoc sp. FACHB-152]|uniref:ferritin-like domain-containing protein n=1 Tax=unclassified Nostoc TaxID=2593658 RepID=UPI001681EDD2|nr:MULTISPECIES: ferritin-like domain-containing protein [unclassified Nostoc]MBD2446371.1 ferritin-like domain-containing protein [Nostoc sp. FACHB-152]MBD2471800.1 ferritin-like domain-containing protein [Nostoc sp. FACHB-145]